MIDTANPILDQLMSIVGKLGYTIHEFRPDRHSIEVLGAVRNYDGQCADVLVMFSETLTAAYRMPVADDIDMFAPQKVYWWYTSTPAETVRALVTLPEPDHSAPGVLVAPPPGYAVPQGVRRNVRIRMRRTK